MKYLVKSIFTDKETKDLHPPGTLYETDNPERANYLIKKGYLESHVEEPSNSDPDNDLLSKNASDVIASISKELSEDVLTSLLEKELAGANRKKVLKHIESLLKKGENDESGTI